MIICPVDESGDILPVLSSADLLRDAHAVARLVQNRLELLAGDWWENPAWGNEILEMLEESRLTGADRQSLAAYLSSYILETLGAGEIRDAAFSAENEKFRFRCVLDTESGTESISYEP